MIERLGKIVAAESPLTYYGLMTLIVGPIIFMAAHTDVMVPTDLLKITATVGMLLLHAGVKLDNKMYLIDGTLQKIIDAAFPKDNQPGGNELIDLTQVLITIPKPWLIGWQLVVTGKLPAGNWVELTFRARRRLIFAGPPVIQLVSVTPRHARPAERVG